MELLQGFFGTEVHVCVHIFRRKLPYLFTVHHKIKSIKNLGITNGRPAASESVDCRLKLCKFDRALIRVPLKVIKHEHVAHAAALYDLVNLVRMLVRCETQRPENLGVLRCGSARSIVVNFGLYNRCGLMFDLVTTKGESVVGELWLGHGCDKVTLLVYL